MELSQSEWQKVFFDQETSGLNYKDFCKLKGINFHTFKNAKHRKSEVKPPVQIKTANPVLAEKPKSPSFIRAEISKTKLPQESLLKLKLSERFEIEFSINQLADVIRAVQAGAK